MLETKLLAGVATLAIAAGSAAFCVWYGYDWGASAVQLKWDTAVREQRDKVVETLEEDRTAISSVRSDYLVELKDLEVKYAKLSSQYSKALSSKVTCPASGKLGDVVMPAELVGSVFATDVIPASPAGSAPGRTGGAVR